MITYIKVYFSTEGPSPISIAEKLSKETGIPFIRGEHDIAFEWETPEEYRSYMEKIYESFKGSKVTLKYESFDEERKPVHLLAQWPPRGGKKPSARPLLTSKEESP